MKFVGEVMMGDGGILMKFAKTWKSCCRRDTKFYVGTLTQTIAQLLCEYIDFQNGITLQLNVNY